jgi:hypothetical protein
MRLTDRLRGRVPKSVVELREVIPHGADQMLVVATVDGRPFRNYVPIGDIASLEPALLRRALAARVRRLATAKPDPTPAPDLTGTESYP